MRAMVDELEFDDFSFNLEFDTGGEPEYPLIVWVYKDGEPFTIPNDNKRIKQVRFYMKEDTAESYIINKCKKFANNEAYRQKIIKENM